MVVAQKVQPPNNPVANAAPAVTVVTVVTVTIVAANAVIALPVLWKHRNRLPLWQPATLLTPPRWHRCLIWI